MIVAHTHTHARARGWAARWVPGLWAACFVGGVAGGAGRPARPARAAWTALRLLANVADSILVIFRFGATMERPRRSSAASYGVSSTTIAKFRSTDVVRPPSLAQRSARKDQRNLAALIMIVAHARARGWAARCSSTC